MNDSIKPIKSCIHCDYPLAASYKFCPNCSQKTEKKRLTLLGFFQDFLSSTISYDSKGMRTIISMLKKPGIAPLNFIQGDKTAYVNPFRMYLYISFLYFFLTSLAEKSREVFFDEGKTLNLTEINASKEKKNQLRMNKNYQKTTINLFGLNINQEKDSTEVLPAKAFDSIKGYKKPIMIFNNFNNFRVNNPDKSKEECFAELGFKDNFWNNYYYKKSDFNLLEDKESLKNHIFNKLPLMLFFNIPIISLLLLLVQIKQPFNFTENMILMFHYMTIVFFLLIFGQLLDIIENGTTFTGIVFSMLMPIYFYKALRNFYQQSRLKTILKFVILSGMFFISLIFMLILNFVFLFLTY